MIAASTTWGLFLLVLMLGYGLVEVPLNIFNQSRVSYTLSHLQFKISKLCDEKMDIEERLDSLVDELIKYCLQIRAHDPMKISLQKIIDIVPEQYTNRITLTIEDYENNRIATNHLIDLPTEKQLIRLHERLKAAIHVHHRIQVLWSRKINEAFYLEDIRTNEESSTRIFIRQNPRPLTWLRRTLFNHHPKLGMYDEIPSHKLIKYVKLSKLFSSCNKSNETKITTKCYTQVF